MRGYVSRARGGALRRVEECTCEYGDEYFSVWEGGEEDKAFHDNQELVQQFKGVISASLSESFDQVSRDTRQLLEMMAGEGSSSNDTYNEDEGQKVVNGRVSRRNDLHSASLASNGGLHLDATIVSYGGVGGGSTNKSPKESIT